MTDMKTATVLLADDHSLYRQGLSLLLSGHFNCKTIGEASTLEEAIEFLTANPETSLALFDLSMPGMDGVQSLAEVRRRFPALKIAVASASEERHLVVTAIAIGLNGYLTKSLPNEEVIFAIEQMMSGRVFVPSSVTTQVPESDETAGSVVAGMNRNPRPDRELTPRQLEILNMIKSGFTNRQIAEKLNISVGTVKVHVGAVLSHLDVRNRVQLISQD